MGNHGSRRGIGVPRSDYDVVTSALRSADVPFTEATMRLTNVDAAFSHIGRRKVMSVALETTSLLFDMKGSYLGREYTARDECDYFKPRAVEEE